MRYKCNHTLVEILIPKSPKILKKILMPFKSILNHSKIFDSEMSYWNSILAQLKLDLTRLNWLHVACRNRLHAETGCILQHLVACCSSWLHAACNLGRKIRWIMSASINVMVLLTGFKGEDLLFYRCARRSYLFVAVLERWKNLWEPSKLILENWTDRQNGINLNNRPNGNLDHDIILFRE